VSGVNKFRIGLELFALLFVSGVGVAQSGPIGLVGEAGDMAIDSLNIAISLEVYPTPGNASGVDVVTFTYNVYNIGTAKLCNIAINNSLSGVALLDPFDLEPGKNSTLTVVYHITSQDRESSLLLNEVSATGYSCKNNLATTTAIATCAVLLS